MEPLDYAKPVTRRPPRQPRWYDLDYSRADLAGIIVFFALLTLALLFL